MGFTWHDKTVLVSGGTGSWGRECIKQLLALDAHKVIVFSRDELKQSELERELGYPDNLRCYLGDVRDLDRLQEVITPKVNVVIHLAALKQVRSGERDPFELVKTNVTGSCNVAKAVLAAGVKRALLISSDKAVHATTLYGMTKAVAERVWLAANAFSPAPHPPFLSLCRFGNALASRGSVLTIWKRQMEAGQPLTITEPSMTRFLITLPTAVWFILHSIAEMTTGGEEFIPDMPAATIGDLAEAFAPGYPVDIVGCRDLSEKWHEEIEPGGARSNDGAWQLSVPEIRALLVEAGLSLVPSPESRVSGQGSLDSGLGTVDAGLRAGGET